MGILDRLLRRRTSEKKDGLAVFASLSQTQLTALASILPMTLEVLRVQRRQTIVVDDMSEADLRLIRSLSQDQFDELMHIQESYRIALNENDNARKLELYESILVRAPWHPFAIKSVGVCHYMAGNKRKAHDYLKKAATLAPDNENILANLRRIESDL